MHILDFESYSMLEFKQVIKADQAHGKFDVGWNNGLVIVNPTQKEALQVYGIMNGIMFRAEDKTLMITPFDDWADTKIAKRIQQALTDMIKAGVITGSWKLIVMDKEETENSLGSTTVSDILKLNLNYEDTIPICFHGTSSDNIDDIQKRGLWPINLKKQKQNWKKGYTAKSKDLIFLTVDFDSARRYAEAAVDAARRRGHKDAKIAIFRIKDLSTYYVVPDDDYTTGQSSMGLLQMLRTGKPPDVKNNYIQGIRNSGQFAYASHIPASKLTLIKNGDEAHS